MAVSFQHRNLIAKSLDRNKLGKHFNGVCHSFVPSRCFSSSGFPYLKQLLSSSASSSSSSKGNGVGVVGVSGVPSVRGSSLGNGFLPGSKSSGGVSSSGLSPLFSPSPFRVGAMGVGNGSTLAATASHVDATPLPAFPCEKSAINSIFEQQTSVAAGREKAFYVNDVGVVERQHARWVNNLPRVRPFYAVKCNPDPTLLRVLAGVGCGFDCASAAEIDAALSMGVPQADIIFANPVKSIRDLKYAREVGVKKMTFDNEAELYKIKEHHPEAELVMRLLADDSGSTMKFGVKFGAPQVQVPGLMSTAHALKLKLIGCSFHIGSGCFDVHSYEKAIALAKSVFDKAEEMGLPKMTLLDIGGGFPGNPNENERSGDTPAFEEFASVIRASLSEHFPEGCGVEVIGEPGRYMATAWSTLFVMVQGKREEPKPADSKDSRRKFLYYINDGVYGSFNCIMFDHAHPEPIPAYRFMDDRVSLDRQRGQAHAHIHPYLQTHVPTVSNSSTGSHLLSSLDGLGAASMATHTAGAHARAYHSTFGRDEACIGTFFGPTCDSLDVVATDYPCEELFVGDWLAFQHAGAYTSAAASTFNGMPKPTVHYCRSRQPSPKMK